MYDLQKVKVPRLTGRALVALVAGVENPITRAALAKRLLRDVGVSAFRKVTIDEVPTGYPWIAPSDENSSSRSKQDQSLNELAAIDTRGPGFAFRTCSDFTDAYRDARLTPSDVAERVIAAVQESNGGDKPLRAVIQIHADELRQSAAASTKRWADGSPIGPLDGVPVAVKDELDQIGYRTTVGTAFLGATPATHDATVVARLRKAGATLIGKTNMHEIGLGVTGFNPNHGPTRNPYNRDHYTGGSSSGSAGAVAAGLCPLAVGADGGGSIRIPASFCGVFGIKATFGRVSEHGAAPLCWSVAHVGPIAATAVDMALGYAVMAGPDALDAHAAKGPKVRFDGLSGDIKGLRIGVFEPYFNDASTEVVGACSRSLEALVARGAKLVNIEIPELEMLRVAHLVTIASEMAQSMERHYGEHRTDFGLDVRSSMALARLFTARDYVRAQRVRTRAIANFAAVFEKCDMIASPSTGCTAPEMRADVMSHGESDLGVTTEIMRFAPPGNFVGIPGISAPVGYDTRGLPIGLQLQSWHWQEHLLLRVAAQVEADVQRTRPSSYIDLLA